MTDLAADRRETLEAVIEEARRRQRRRRRLLGLLTLSAAAAGLGLYFAAFSSSGTPTPVSAGPKLPKVTGLRISASVGPLPTAWTGVITVTKNHCRKTALPHAPYVGLAWSGNRFAYLADAAPRTIETGAIGGKIRSVRIQSIAAGPVWANGRIAYASRRRILFVGGGSIEPKLPAGARIDDLAAHGNRFAVYAMWGNGLQFTLKGALFVVANGTTRKIEDEPKPYAEGPRAVWSPDGSRIAFVRNGDIWTVSADGGDRVRVTHSLPPVTNGGVVWSPDSRQVAYWKRHLGPTIDTWVAPAAGGIENEITHTVQAPAGVPQTGTEPAAWVGKWIAVTRYNVLGVVPAAGGSLHPLCVLLPETSAYFGSAQWR